MSKLKFCPKCGHKSLNWDGEKKWSCGCGFTLFHNVAGAVAVLLKSGNEYFFTRRNQEPKKGKLDLAGGFVDPRESAETTCEREIFEELRLKIDKTKLRYIASLPNVYHYKGIDYNTVDLFYEYEVEQKFEVSLAEDEISEVCWLKISEISLDDIAFESQKKFFSEFLKNQ